MMTFVAVTPVAAALAAVVAYACAGELHHRRPDPVALRRVVADLDDYTWRAGQLARAGRDRARDDLDAARVDLAFERVYAPLRDKHPLAPRPPRGIDVISRWWWATDPPPAVLILDGAMA
jgi:hypothetical protein